MKKILINKQTERTRRDIMSVDGLCKKINEILIPEFLKLGISEFTADFLNDALFNKNQKAIELLKIQANEETSKVRNLAIKSVYDRAIAEQIESYIQSSKISISVNEEFLLKYVAISENTATPTDGYKEKISEENLYFIETPEELAIYNALLKIADGINEFNSSLGETVKKHVFAADYYINFLIKKQNGLVEFDTETDIKLLAK